MMREATKEFADKRNEAFTLVEIALSLFVVAIGLLGIFALYPAGLKASRSAVDESRLALIGESILSDLRKYMSTNYSDSANGFEFVVYTTATNVSNKVAADDSEVQIYDVSGIEPICKVRLDVNAVAAGKLADATLRMTPGGSFQTNDEIVYYARFAKRE